MTVSANIFYGATEGPEDKRMLDNKVQVANQFTKALRLDPAKLAAYSGNAAAAPARGNLAEVTSSANSVTTATSGISALYSSLLAIASSSNNPDATNSTGDTGNFIDGSNPTGNGTSNSSSSGQTAFTQA